MFKWIGHVSPERVENCIYWHIPLWKDRPGILRKRMSYATSMFHTSIVELLEPFHHVHLRDNHEEAGTLVTFHLANITHKKCRSETVSDTDILAILIAVIGY